MVSEWIVNKAQNKNMIDIVMRTFLELYESVAGKG